MADAFKKQGFAATELVTRWHDIVGAEIAAHAEPIKLQWPRAADGEPAEPATLVLRVEGPVAIEIQHQSARDPRAGQPLLRLAGGRPDRAPPGAAVAPRRPSRAAELDAAEAARLRPTLTDVADDGLRDALGRLGAAVKRR